MKLNFDLNKEQRNSLWEHLIVKLEDYYKNTSSLRVTPNLSIDEVHQYLYQNPIGQSVDPTKVIDFVIEGLIKFAVQTPHPMYYGLYNPRTTFPSILGDTIAATLNPQLAAWSHSPFAAELENYLIREFGKKFGYDENSIDGTFASGGAEANQTAVLVALCNKFPDYPIKGLQNLNVKPVFYASSESHHSFVKAAQTSGIGRDSFIEIPVEKDFRMSAEKFEKQILEDQANMLTPFMVVATASTTGAGIIDPIIEIGQVARKYGLWFHVDAAYGGAAILCRKLKNLMIGIEMADSITFDAHKWLSVPMGCSLFMTKHISVLEKIFGIQTNYMPLDAEGIPVTDPYTHSIQWSRRFIGLKLYLSLLVFGWDGYEKIIQQQADMGRLLKSELVEANWEILNQTDLPVVCFTDKVFKDDERFAKFVVDKVVKSGQAWISVYKFGGISTLRACITNYNTGKKNIRDLVTILNGFREEYKKESIC